MPGSRRRGRAGGAGGRRAADAGAAHRGRRAAAHICGDHLWRTFTSRSRFVLYAAALGSSPSTHRWPRDRRLHDLNTGTRGPRGAFAVTNTYLWASSTWESAAACSSWDSRRGAVRCVRAAVRRPAHESPPVVAAGPWRWPSSTSSSTVLSAALWVLMACALASRPGSACGGCGVEWRGRRERSLAYSGSDEEAPGSTGQRAHGVRGLSYLERYSKGSIVAMRAPPSLIRRTEWRLRRSGSLQASSSEGSGFAPALSRGLARRTSPGVLLLAEVRPSAPRPPSAQHQGGAHRPLGGSVLGITVVYTPHEQLALHRPDPRPGAALLERRYGPRPTCSCQSARRRRARSCASRLSTGARARHPDAVDLPERTAWCGARSSAGPPRHLAARDLAGLRRRSRPRRVSSSPAGPPFDLPSTACCRRRRRGPELARPKRQRRPYRSLLRLPGRRVTFLAAADVFVMPSRSRACHSPCWRPWPTGSPSCARAWVVIPRAPRTAGSPGAARFALGWPRAPRARQDAETRRALGEAHGRASRGSRYPAMLSASTGVRGRPCARGAAGCAWLGRSGRGFRTPAASVHRHRRSSSVSSTQAPHRRHRGRERGLTACPDDDRLDRLRPALGRGARKNIARVSRTHWRRTLGAVGLLESGQRHRGVAPSSCVAARRTAVVRLDPCARTARQRGATVIHLLSSIRRCSVSSARSSNDVRRFAHPARDGAGEAGAGVRILLRATGSWSRLVSAAVSFPRRSICAHLAPHEPELDRDGGCRPCARRRGGSSIWAPWSQERGPTLVRRARLLGTSSPRGGRGHDRVERTRQQGYHEPSRSGIGDTASTPTCGGTAWSPISRAYREHDVVVIPRAAPERWGSRSG